MIIRYETVVSLIQGSKIITISTIKIGNWKISDKDLNTFNESGEINENGLFSSFNSTTYMMTIKSGEKNLDTLIKEKQFMNFERKFFKSNDNKNYFFYVKLRDSTYN